MSCCRSQGISEAAVIGVPDEQRGERVVAFVVAEEIDPVRVRDFVAERLSRHKWPAEIHTVAELPRNSVGKVLKRQLTESYVPRS